MSRHLGDVLQRQLPLRLRRRPVLRAAVCRLRAGPSHLPERLTHLPGWLTHLSDRLTHLSHLSEGLARLSRLLGGAERILGVVMVSHEALAERALAKHGAGLSRAALLQRADDLRQDRQDLPHYVSDVLLGQQALLLAIGSIAEGREGLLLRLGDQRGQLACDFGDVERRELPLLPIAGLHAPIGLLAVASLPEAAHAELAERGAIALGSEGGLSKSHAASRRESSVLKP